MPTRARLRETAAVGILSSLAFAGGYLFIAVPNVEIFTAIVFLSGLLLGPRGGMLVGLIAQTLYATLNPYGVSPPPLLVAQILNRVLVGYVGGRFRTLGLTEGNPWRLGMYFGTAGLLLTVLFDLMTDVSFFFVSGFSLQQMKTTFTFGLPFYLVHSLVNTGVFGLVLPFVVRALRRTALLRVS